MFAQNSWNDLGQELKKKKTAQYVNSIIISSRDIGVYYFDYQINK